MICDLISGAIVVICFGKLTINFLKNPKGKEEGKLRTIHSKA